MFLQGKQDVTSNTPESVSFISNFPCSLQFKIYIFCELW